MKWIYVSPHLDDAVFSCGGLIWEQTKSGDQVEIWTIFAGDPPDNNYSTYAIKLHQDWGLTEDMINVRREEDLKACQILGAAARHFPYPDCIYRKSPQGESFYQAEQDIFGGINPEELSLIDSLVDNLADQLPKDANIIGPLGIGNHVDHDITRKALSRLNIEIDYYMDYPYLRETEGKEILFRLKESSDWEDKTYVITDEGFSKWHAAALVYSSQIPVFWDEGASLLSEIRGIFGDMGGVLLWKTIESD